MRNLLFMFLILVFPSQLWSFEEPYGSRRLPDALTFEHRHTMDQGQEPEPPLEEGKIEDLKGIKTVFLDAPDEYSSLFLRKIVETVRKKIPRLIFVWAKDEADVWLLFSVESNVKDAKVRGRIIRSLEPGHLRLVERYAGTANKGAEGFAKEFVKDYQKANPDPQADVAQPQPAQSPPPRLREESTSVAGSSRGTTSARKASNSDEVSEGDILRTDTSLVTILAEIMSRDGKAAPDMQAADFSVYENDVKQNIAFFEPVDRPFSVVLLIDSSTSVEAELSEIKRAAKVLVDRLRPDDQLVVVNFNAKIKEVLKLAKISELRGASIEISPHGGTRLYDVVNFAASKYLRRLPGRKAVVLLTDGVDFGSFKTTAEGSIRDAEEYDALFYTIQYKSSEPQSTPVEKAQRQYEYERATAYLRELAEKTGGRYQRAQDMDDLSATFASVVKELSSQYSLGYYPLRPPQPGERRRIRVQVSQLDLVVHTRSSYVFKSPEAKPALPK
jgi:Ca-activated chloride channel family protein